MNRHTLFHISLPVLLCALTAGLAQAQGVARERRPVVVVHAADASGWGDLVTYDEPTGLVRPTHADWRALRILPVDFVGRVALEQLDLRRPRLAGEGTAAPRVLLQGGRGALYRYARQLPTAGPRFGWMWLPPDGSPRSLLEMAGSGPGQDFDPFLPQVGVADGGRALLIASLPAAGGDLFEVELPSGAVHERSAQLPPLAFSGAGLWLLDGWGFGVASEGIYRFARTPAAQAQRVHAREPVGGFVWSGEAVVSAGRTRAMATAGNSPSQRAAYVFGEEGQAVRVPGPLMDISSAGFLPQSGAGPYMAVSDDGALIAWRMEGIKRELLVSQPRVHAHPTLVSADAWFLDTLDQIGVLGIYQPGVVTAAIGATPGPGEELAIEKLDLFEIELPQVDQPTFRNLSLTSGDGSAPFLSPGEIEPDILAWVPEAQSYLIADGNDERLGHVPASTGGFVTLLGGVKEGYWVERVGTQLVAALRRSADPRPRELYSLPIDLSASPSLLVPGAAGWEYPARSLGVAGVLAYRVEQGGPGLEWLMRVRPATGQLESFAPLASTYSAPLGRTALGATLLRQGTAGSLGQLWLWPAAGSALPLGAPSSSAVVLPTR